MKPLLLGLGAATLCSATLLAAANKPVAITGCVHAGADPGSYVLFDVDEVTDGHPVPAGAVYWLSSTKQLTAHVGHKVEVRGSYSLARDVARTARPKVKTDRADSRDELRPVGTTGVLPAEVKGPYRKLEVNRVRMVGASCDVP